MRPLYTRSIFAHELEAVIGEHEKKLSDLTKSPLAFDRKKVVDLTNSLKSDKRLPALNYGEIESIVILLKLDNVQRCRIYAALIALGVQRLLLGYLSSERAWQVAMEVRESVLNWLLSMGKDDEHNPFRRIRGKRSLEEASETGQPDISGDTPEDVLAAALNSYDEGVALATLAQFDRAQHNDAEARYQFRQAQLSLVHATMLLDQLRSRVSEHDAEEHTYWSTETAQALTDVEKALQGV